MRWPFATSAHFCRSWQNPCQAISPLDLAFLTRPTDLPSSRLHLDGSCDGHATKPAPLRIKASFLPTRRKQKKGTKTRTPLVTASSHRSASPPPPSALGRYDPHSQFYLLPEQSGIHAPNRHFSEVIRHETTNYDACASLVLRPNCGLFFPFFLFPFGLCSRLRPRLHSNITHPHARAAFLEESDFCLRAYPRRQPSPCLLGRHCAPLLKSKRTKGYPVAVAVQRSSPGRLNFLFALITDFSLQSCRPQLFSLYFHKGK